MSWKVLVFVAVQIVLSFAGDYVIKTPATYDRQSLNVDMSGTSSVTFSINTRNDAIVGLQKTSTGKSGDAYEIVIGGWGNTKAVIRKKSGGNHFAEYNRYSGFMTDGVFVDFWISWGNQRIKVGDGKVVGQNTFLDVYRDNNYQVKGLSVTGFDQVGTWKFSSILPYNEYVTPHNYVRRSLNVDMSSVTSVTFDIKSCNDAIIGLQKTSNGDSGEAYEIVIGGWGNTKAVIRERSGGNHYAEKNDYSGYLSCSEFRKFWISWGSGLINIGKGNVVGQNGFLSAYWNSYAVKGLSITGFDKVGHWRFTSAPF